jgi:hypothetical protein
MAVINETQIKISDSILEDYKKTADKWEKVLQELPIAQAQDVLQYMRGITGLRGKMHLGSISAKSEFGPYSRDRKNASDVKIDYRDITTYMGSVIEDFHPNDYAMLTMGYTQPTLGDALKGASTTLLVLAQIAKARGEALSYAIFNGVRNEAGSKTVDLFDGFHKIADDEIKAGNISVENANLYKVKDAITKANACDIAKDIVFSLNHYLRREKAFLFCSQDFADMYNESYLDTHSGLVYNKEYNQVVVEGSNGNLSLCPLPQLDGASKFYVSPQANMLWGTDNKSAMTTNQIDRFAPFTLTYSATLFFGVNFHSIDPRKLKVVDLSDVITA